MILELDTNNKMKDLYAFLYNIDAGIVIECVYTYFKQIYVIINFKNWT